MRCFKIAIENKHRGCAVVLAALDVFMRQLGATSEEKEEFKTAVKEAVENAINYAYPKDEEEHLITVTTIAKGNVVTVTVKDKGRGIKKLKTMMQPTKTSCPGKHSGMGFTIMQAFSNGVTVDSSENGTTVTLVRYLK